MMDLSELAQRLKDRKREERQERLSKIKSLGEIVTDDNYLAWLVSWLRDELGHQQELEDNNYGGLGGGEEQIEYELSGAIYTLETVITKYQTKEDE